MKNTRRPRRAKVATSSPTRPPTHLLVPFPLAQQILDYLQLRPFNEVFQLIDGLGRARPVVQPSSSTPIDTPEETKTE